MSQTYMLATRNMLLTKTVMSLSLRNLQAVGRWGGEKWATNKQNNKSVNVGKYYKRSKIGSGGRRQGK